MITDDNLLITAVKPNRTLDGVEFKIRQPKPNYHSSVDNENKKFFQIIKKMKKNKK